MMNGRSQSGDEALGLVIQSSVCFRRWPQRERSRGTLPVQKEKDVDWVFEGVCGYGFNVQKQVAGSINGAVTKRRSLDDCKPSAKCAPCV